MGKSYLSLSELGNFQIKYLPEQKKKKNNCETAGPLHPRLLHSQYVSELFWIPCELQKLNELKTALPTVVVHLKMRGNSKSDGARVIGRSQFV